ncbi:MAG: sensor histidine kinase [Thermoplasmatota archaeon]
MKDETGGSGRVKTGMEDLAKYVDNTAHQMKTPITVIKTYLELILAELYGPITPETGEKISTIDSNISEIIYFIEQIQDVIMLSCGDADPELELQDVCLITKKVAGELSELGRSRQVAIVMEDFDRSIHIPLDEHCTRRVIANLLRHVISTSPRGKTVTVSLDQCDGRLDMSIGAAMVDLSESDLESMLASMFEKDAPLTNIDWERLSVPIASRIMDLQGGRLRISRDETKGSHFILSFNELPPQL